VTRGADHVGTACVRTTLDDLSWHRARDHRQRDSRKLAPGGPRYLLAPRPCGAYHRRVIELRAALGTSTVHALLCAALATVFSPIPIWFVDPDFTHVEPTVVPAPVIYSIDAPLVPTVFSDVEILAKPSNGCRNRARLDRFPRLQAPAKAVVRGSELTCLHVASDGRVDQIRSEGASAVERRLDERYAADLRFEPAWRDGHAVGAWVALTPLR
jgi:hypothetical protein